MRSTTGNKSKGSRNRHETIRTGLGADAITIGTLDGANIEIRDAVGHENFFLFGLTAEEVGKLKSSGYSPSRIYEANPTLREAIDLIDSGFFSNGDRKLFRPLVESLLNRDDYMLLADYQTYVDCQQRVSEAYRDLRNWTCMSILNSARVGRFSSDRSIREYCRDIWNVNPITTSER
jgi:starch phosphorylase